MMESNYRHMMGQITLDDQARERIMERLEEPAAVKAPGRHIRPLRAALLAACVCLALVGSVFAGQALLGVRFHGADQGTYKMSAGGLTGFSRGDFGRQMAEDIQNAPDPDGTVCQAFGSWEELETYVGMPLAYNPLLDETARLMCPTDENDLTRGYEWYDGADPDGRPLYRYSMLIRRVSAELLDGSIGADSRLDGVDIDLDVSFFGQDNTPSESFPLYSAYDSENCFRPEEYAMKNGCQAQLIFRYADAGAGSPLGCDAYFVYGGMLYRLHFNAPEGRAVAPALVQWVLDAFQ